MLTSSKNSIDLNTVKLRSMKKTDVDRVREIEKLAYQFPWSRQIINDCMKAGYSCWVAESVGTIQGYGVLMIAAGESHILNVCVNPGIHKQGLGQHIVKHLLGVSRDQEIETVYLEVRPSNEAAYILYSKLGFNEVGQRKGYYPAKGGKREDALIMALSLI